MRHMCIWDRVNDQTVILVHLLGSSLLCFIYTHYCTVEKFGWGERKIGKFCELPVIYQNPN